MASNAVIDIDPKDILGRLDFLVDLNKSIRRPKGDTTVIKTKYGLLFPEDIALYNDGNRWLYAFGSTHIWRSIDGDEWELVR